MWAKMRETFLASVDRTLATIASVLPALVAMVLMLALSVLFAVVARALARRLFVRVNLDQRLRAWGMAAPAAQGRSDPSVLIARFIYWLVLALGPLGALSAFDATGQIAKKLITYLPNALAGVAVFLVGLAASRAVERGVLIGAVNAGLQSARLLGLGARWLLVVLVTAMALEQLGVGGTILVLSFSILFGGIVLALSLAVGLGARDTVARSLERAFPAVAEPPKERGPEAEAPPTEYHHM